MILLDEGATWNGESKVVTYWSQLNVSAPQESIPLRTEKQAKEIRAEYLAWVHDLGRTPLGEKTLAAYLKVMNNLSYWWMTSIAIKSTFQNDSVYTVFKLRALEQLYLEKKCSGLVYCGNNQVLHETLKNWCRTLAHPYQKCRVANQNTPKNNNIRNLYFLMFD